MMSQAFAAMKENERSCISKHPRAQEMLNQIIPFTYETGIPRIVPNFF
jgi:hypothetical protein